MPTEPAPQQWLRQQENWAVAQARRNREDAVYRSGEYAIFVLLWQIEDFKAGLVTRCSTCMVPNGMVAEVFKQPADPNCPNCLGTTFNGGYKAKIVRPSIWNMPVPNDVLSQRGEQDIAAGTVQSTYDFRLRHGDYGIRADNTRWRAMNPDRSQVGIGFGYKNEADKSIAFIQTMHLEPPGSVAYTKITPIVATDVATLLDPAGYIPTSFTSYDVIRAGAVIL